MGLISLAKAKKFVGGAVDGDDRIREVLEALEEELEDETNRLWASRTAFNEIIEVPDDRERLFLQGYPVTNLSLTEYAKDPADAVAVTAADFTLDSQRGIVRRLRSTSWKRFVSATYDCGLAEGQLPASVETAVLLELDRRVRRSAPDKVVLRSQGFDGGSTSYQDIGQRHPEYMRVIRSRRRYARNV